MAPLSTLKDITVQASAVAVSYFAVFHSYYYSSISSLHIPNNTLITKPCFKFKK